MICSLQYMHIFWNKLFKCHWNSDFDCKKKKKNKPCKLVKNYHVYSINLDDGQAWHAAQVFCAEQQTSELRSSAACFLQLSSEALR